MLHLYDRATMARAMTLDLDLDLHTLLAQRIAALTTEFGDLIDYTEFLIVEAADTEDDIVERLSFSPMIDPIDGHRWPDPRFTPVWDIIIDRDSWFEMIVTFGSTAAAILLIQARDDELGRLCREHAAPQI